jgi:hypothetical protein
MIASGGHVPFDIARLVDDTRGVLDLARLKAGPSFSGLGLIVCDYPGSLPLAPLSVDQPQFHGRDLADVLAGLSLGSGQYHDGFHVLDTQLRLLAVSQYFSPPVHDGIWKPSGALRGGRYVAALFGSVLSEVTLTAVASSNYGIVVFVDGHEVL